MRVGFPGGPRLEWYDRNPLSKNFGYAEFDVAPHAPVVRWTYTVPTGKKFFLESTLSRMQRTAAATAVGRAYSHVYARATSPVYAQLITNTVGDVDAMNVGRSVIMQAGEVLAGYTGDLSAGGTIDYTLMAHGIEFDA